MVIIATAIALTAGLAIALSVYNGQRRGNSEDIETLKHSVRELESTFANNITRLQNEIDAIRNGYNESIRRTGELQIEVTTLRKLAINCSIEYQQLTERLQTLSDVNISELSASIQQLSSIVGFYHRGRV